MDDNDPGGLTGGYYELGGWAARWHRLRSRVLGPVTCWLSNRWHWREARRVRRMTAGWVPCPTHRVLGPPGSPCERCGELRPGG